VTETADASSSTAPLSGPLAGPRRIEAFTPAGVITASYDSLRFDPEVARSVRIFRGVRSHRRAALMMLAWVLTELDGAGPRDAPLWQRLEGLSDDTISRLCAALAMDRRRALEERVEDARVRCPDCVTDPAERERDRQRKQAERDRARATAEQS
jgi:hypothetical protein